MNKLYDKIINRFQAKESETTIDNPTSEEQVTATSNDRRYDRTMKSLKEFESLDNAAYEYYRTFTPVFNIKKVGNKTFISMYGQEFIAEYCSSISVLRIGNPPNSRVINEVYAPSEIVVTCASQAVVIVTYGSGKTVEFTCNRHVVDAVYHELLSAYRKVMGGSWGEEKNNE